jgi:membrane-bound lytic murein transglycosylase B
MRRFIPFLLCLLLGVANDAPAAPLDASAVRDFIAYMNQKHGFASDALTQTFAQVSRLDRIIELMSKPAEKVKPWYEYRALFITDKRIREGAAFWRANEAAVLRAADTYGVAPEVIIAIIGVETSYGQNVGNYRVIDALSTLAFHYPGNDSARAAFFRSQLEQFLLMTRDDHLDPLALTGSYAGAMGMPQFMPDSYRRLAVDFDGDGARNIWSDAPDAIGSVANYLHEHGWRRAGAVTTKARIGSADPAPFLKTTIKPSFRLADFTAAGILPMRSNGNPDDETALFELEGSHGNEYWIGYTNFYVISRYNPRVKYAMAVAQLSEEIRKLHGGPGS